jgi:mono/diheme cytochrome c family protein
MSRANNGTSQLSTFAMLGSGAGVFAFLLQGLLSRRPAVPTYEPPGYPEPPGAPAMAPGPIESPKGGEALYMAKCSGCHQANGGGLPGAFPPLAGSSWVDQDPETPIRIALLGLSGPIEVAGQHFESAMPALGLSDGEIAEILSHVRSSWGNQAAPITPEAVAQVRSSLAGRTNPWDAQTLSSLRGGK